MLKQRLITALILLVIFIATLLAPRPEFFGALTLIFIGVGGWEWSRLNGIAGAGVYVLGTVVVLICAALWYLELVQQLPMWLWFVTGATWVIGAPIILRDGSECWLTIPAGVRWVLGIFILCMAWSALWASKLIGNNFLLSVLFMVWGADTGAYFGGKTFGKRKLAPKISPGKSWEGAISGAITVLLLAAVWIFLDQGVLASNMTGSSLSIFSMLYQKWGVLGLLPILVFLTAMSVVGDLSESLMKRSVGMKDSSNVLPGHGGVLDRVDALLPVLPLSIALVTLL